jgi:hypothetical protein
MYDLPLIVAASRRRRKQTLHGAASYAGVPTSMMGRIENGYGEGCDVRTLIKVLHWLESE